MEMIDIIINFSTYIFALASKLMMSPSTISSGRLEKILLRVMSSSKRAWILLVLLKPGSGRSILIWAKTLSFSGHVRQRTFRAFEFWPV